MKTFAVAVFCALVCASLAWPNLKLKRRDFEADDLRKALTFCRHNGFSEQECREGLKACEENGKDGSLTDCLNHHMENGVVFPEIRKGLLACQIFGVSDKDCVKRMEECADNDHLHFLACAEYQLTKEGVDCQNNDCQDMADRFMKFVEEGMRYCDDNDYPHCDCVHGIRECLENDAFGFDECKNYHESKDSPAEKRMKAFLRALKKK